MSRKVWASLAAQGHFGSIHFGWSAGYTKAVPPVTLIYQASERCDPRAIEQQLVAQLILPATLPLKPSYI